MAVALAEESLLFGGLVTRMRRKDKEFFHTINCFCLLLFGLRSYLLIHTFRHADGPGRTYETA